MGIDNTEKYLRARFPFFPLLRRCFSTFTLMSLQRIYLSTKKAKEAVQNKSSLECLAFCVMGKLTFGDSIMRKRTAREYKALFHMGTERFKRVLTGCLQSGLIADMGNTYVFRSIKDPKAFNVPIELPIAWGQTEEKICPVKIDDVMDYIRKVVMYNHLSIKEKIADAINVMNRPKSCSAYARAKKLIKRVATNLPMAYHNMITTGRIARTMHTYKSKARKLIREMAHDGWINVQQKTRRIMFGLKHFSPQTLPMLRSFGWLGSYFRIGHDILCRSTNEYKLTHAFKLKFLN